MPSGIEIPTCRHDFCGLPNSEFILYLVGSKFDVSFRVLRARLNDVLSAFDGCQRMFTDGSMDEFRSDAVTSSAILVNAYRRLVDFSFLGYIKILLALNAIEF